MKEFFEFTFVEDQVIQKVFFEIYVFFDDNVNSDIQETVLNAVQLRIGDDYYIGCSSNGGVYIINKEAEITFEPPDFVSRSEIYEFKCLDQRKIRSVYKNDDGLLLTFDGGNFEILNYGDELLVYKNGCLIDIESLMVK